ncbi:alkaline shock response membrane anchor protein AmaP [Microbispora hainanensis]|uniref:Alkaline shock response membrane anchor protein AmaP n=1 Tax=Microbispora hainanensis TaxID=568844 RepID=A0A544YAV8_9ACTN|nr:alkaline shock response membrane anchor protein AmaP [Microbispora hainanensis]TQS13864.1 alkaline shock response membrane anchor protein AmaP [Microbispora hainanensis]
MKTRSGKGNRVGLAVLGLVLLAVGGLAIARALGSFGDAAAREPVVDAGARSFAATTPWFWPVVAAVGIVIGLIGLAWLLALLRVDRPRRLRLESGTTGVTEVDAHPASEALAEQVSTYPEVRRAHAVLRGPSDDPHLDIGVSAEEPADLGALVTRLHDEAVPDLRTTLGLRRLPAMVRLNLTGGRRTRPVH